MLVRALILALLSLANAGCEPVREASLSTAMGWRFGPAFDCDDRSVFAEEPRIIHRGDQYVFAWTYGTMGFFFRPNYEAQNGRLIFVLQGMTSNSNALAGRPSEIPIEGEENIAALRTGGVYWWQSDGAYVALDIIEGPVSR